MSKILKQYGMLALSLAAMAVICALSMNAIQAMKTSGQTIFDVGVNRIAAVSDISILFERQRALVGSAPAILDLAQLAQSEKEFNDFSEKISAMATDFDDFTALHSAFTENSKKVFEFAKLFAQNQAVDHLKKHVLPAGKAVSDDLARLSHEAHTVSSENLENLEAIAKNSSFLMLGIAGGLFVLVLGVGAFQANRQRIEQRAAHTIFDNTLEVLKSVVAASDNIQSLSGDMTNQANEAFSKINSVTHATEQTSDNIQAVSASVEQMTATAEQIRQRVGESGTITQRALEASQNASSTVQGMTTAVSKISEVLNLINDISEQTNLLALNAAIEAARAGEAGRGFAVVAEEVRKLSNQTNTATAEIVVQIQSIQEASRQVFDSTNNMSTTIAEMNEISRVVINAVDEQTTATEHVAHSINAVSNSANQVTSDMVEVSNVAQTVGNSSTSMKSSADTLFNQANNLNEQISSFIHRAQT